MSPDASLKDLILLVADKDIEYALRGILSKRQRAIGIRETAWVDAPSITTNLLL